MKSLLLSLVLVALMLLLADSGYAEIDETMVLYLSFNEGAGDEVKDGSGYENHGKIVATNKVKRVKGKFGGAIEITGLSADCVVVPNSDSLKITGQITMMAWIKSAGWTGGDQIIDKHQHNGAQDTNHSYGMGIFDDGQSTWLSLGSGEALPSLVLQKVPPAEEWHHLVGTHDGKTMRFYLDGEVFGEKAEKFNVQGTNETDVRIGCANARGQYAFNGIIDEVVIYNRALDQEEIKEVMEVGPITAVSADGKLATTWASVKSLIIN